MSSVESSEDENAEKFKEAVWSFQPRTNEAGKDGGRTVKASKRVNVKEHDYDGNELQTTPEFRSHVAGKLTAMLDRFITEVTSGTPDTKPEQEDDGEEEKDDAGFRLFSTSLPGRCSTESPQQLPSKRPLPPSSSDSDSEMELRLREAAVRVSDLVPFFTEEPQKNRDTEEKDRTAPTEEEEEEERKRRKKKRKKKKKKAPTEEREEEKFASSKTSRTIHS